MQLKGLPFVVFDQGGVMEMIDNKGMAGNVILEPTADALYTKLSGMHPYSSSVSGAARWGCLPWYDQDSWPHETIPGQKTGSSLMSGGRPCCCAWFASQVPG